MKRIFLVLVLVLVVVAGCGSDAEETPVPEASPEAETTNIGSLRVVKTPVQYAPRETDAPRELESGEQIDIAPGANVVVLNGGRAELGWPGFLSQEMLAGTDVLVSLAEPAARTALLDQATGTARYKILGTEGVDLTVQAGWVKATSNSGPADFIVTFVPGDPPSVWVTSIDGDITVVEGSIETPESEAEQSVTISAGQAAGFASEGDLHEPMTVDVATIEDWYLSVAAGTAEGPLPSVALWCTVDAAVSLKTEPADDADDAETSIAVGDRVRVLQRDADAEWLRVVPEDDDAAAPGWLEATALTCLGPVSAASTEGEEAEATEIPTEAPATVAPGVTARPTFTPAAVATRTPTPTGTPTASAAAEINFSVDRDEIPAGECATLSWDVKNVREVHIRPGIGGVPGENQTHEVCPDETTTYTLEVTKLDGSKETREVTVKVIQPEEPEATDTPASLPSSTPEPDPTQEPTQEPTDEPDPTDTPQTS